MYNTNSSASRYEFGTIATYICDTSYVLSVNLKPRVCRGDSIQGLWNGNTPICKCKDVYFNHIYFVVTLVVLIFCGIFFICVQIVITIFIFPYLKHPNYELAIDHYNNVIVLTSISNNMPYITSYIIVPVNATKYYTIMS